MKMTRGHTCEGRPTPCKQCFKDLETRRAGWTPKPAGSKRVPAHTCGGKLGAGRGGLEPAKTAACKPCVAAVKPTMRLGTFRSLTVTPWQAEHEHYGMTRYTDDPHRTHNGFPLGYGRYGSETVEQVEAWEARAANWTAQKAA